VEVSVRKINKKRYECLYIVDGNKINKELEEELSLFVKEMTEKKMNYQIIFIPTSAGTKKLGLNGKYYIKDNDFDKIKATYKKAIRLPKNTIQKVDLMESATTIVEDIVIDFIRRVKEYENELEKLEFNKELPGKK
jgi:hypothetical protein